MLARPSNGRLEYIMPLQLVIGNKAYSSWSLRPWILMSELRIRFDERLVPLFQEDSARRLTKLSPSGRVPVPLTVTESDVAFLFPM